jgi:hypothetical protein
VDSVRDDVRGSTCGDVPWWPPGIRSRRISASAFCVLVALAVPLSDRADRKTGKRTPSLAG